MAAESERLLALQRTLYASSNPTRRYLHCRRRDWVIERLEVCGSVDIAIEVGTGSGVYLPTLAEAAQRVLVLDREDAYLRGLPALPDSDDRLLLILADARRAPLPDRCVDLLLCSEVIEHVEDSQALLTALAALLVPEGRLILTTPQAWSPLECLGRIALLPPFLPLLRWIYGEPVEPTGHINLLSQRALRSQIEKAGLRVVERDVLGMYLPLVAEFGGNAGQRFLAWLEGRIAGTPLQSLLWTQCYVLMRREDMAQTGE